MYTLIIDYFATGEGRSVWVGRVGAINKEDAKDKFKKLFKQFDDQEYWDYFSIGLDIYDDQVEEERKIAKKYLNGYLKNSFTNSLLTEYVDFSMKLHYNFS